MSGESGGELLVFLGLCWETISFSVVGFITAIIIGLSSRIFKCCIWIRPAAVNFNLKSYICKNVSNVKMGHIGSLGKINVDI